MTRTHLECKSGGKGVPVKVLSVCATTLHYGFIAEDIEGVPAFPRADEGSKDNTFRGFAELADWLAVHLKVESAVLDGEIACVDGEGRPIFKDLLFWRSTCIFVSI